MELGVIPHRVWSPGDQRYLGGSGKVLQGSIAQEKEETPAPSCLLSHELIVHLLSLLLQRGKSNIPSFFKGVTWPLASWAFPWLPPEQRPFPPAPGSEQGLPSRRGPAFGPSSAQRKAGATWEDREGDADAVRHLSRGPVE